MFLPWDRGREREQYTVIYYFREEFYIKPINTHKTCEKPRANILVWSLTSIIVLSHHPIENAKNIYTIRDKDTFTRNLWRLLWLRAYGTFLAGREFCRMITADFISVYFIWFEIYGNLQNKKRCFMWHRKLLGEKGHQNIPSQSSCFQADGNNSHFADCQDFFFT